MPLYAWLRSDLLTSSALAILIWALLPVCSSSWKNSRNPCSTTLDEYGFYVTPDVEWKITMRASVAQAFDYLGQGLVLRGEPFEWDETAMGRSPHLPREAARRLIQRTLTEYVKVNKNLPPRRVVIHKSFTVQLLELVHPYEIRSRLPNGGWRKVSVRILIALLANDVVRVVEES